jgi:hypothetical protein
MISSHSRLSSCLRSIWSLRTVRSRGNCSKASCVYLPSPRSKHRFPNSRLESPSFKTLSHKSYLARRMCTLTNSWRLQPLEATKLRSKPDPPNRPFISSPHSPTLFLVPNRCSSSCQGQVQGSRLSRCSNLASLKTKDQRK